MSSASVIVGLGEMGGAFAHGFLRGGETVVPVTRETDLDSVGVAHPDPELVLVAVGEAELDGVLAALPASWKDRVVLLQNELLPVDWEARGIVEPTVAIVWFEKKRHKAVNVVLPTVVAGPRAARVVAAIEAIGLPAHAVESERLLFELVKKNLYILTANIAGLDVGGTVLELWRDHHDLAADVAAEILALQAWRAGQVLPRHDLLAAMVEAFEGDPDHGCTGRSAPRRLARALGHAKEAALEVRTLSAIAERHGVRAAG